jgi:hypothetical protein
MLHNINFESAKVEQAGDDTSAEDGQEEGSNANEDVASHYVGHDEVVV